MRKVGRNKRREKLAIVFPLATPRSSGTKRRPTCNSDATMRTRTPRMCRRIDTVVATLPEQRGQLVPAKQLAHPLVPAYNLDIRQSCDFGAVADRTNTHFKSLASSTSDPTRSIALKWSSKVSTVAPTRAADAAIQISLVGKGVPFAFRARTISA